MMIVQNEYTNTNTYENGSMYFLFQTETKYGKIPIKVKFVLPEESQLIRVWCWSTVMDSNLCVGFHFIKLILTICFHFIKLMLTLFADNWGTLVHLTLNISQCK